MYSLAAAVSVSAKIGKQLKSSWAASEDADEDAEEDDDVDADEDDEDGDEDADEDDEDTNNSVSAMSARCVAEGGCLLLFQVSLDLGCKLFIGSLNDFFVEFRHGWGGA